MPRGRGTGPARIRSLARWIARGDWDLAVFDARGRLVAGSAAFGTDELAEGFAAPGTLTVQACRRTGSGRRASLDVDAFALPAPRGGGTREHVRLVRVSTPTRALKTRLQALGHDLTEHGGERHLDVVTYGDADLAKLRAAKFDFRVVVDDLAMRDFENARRDAAFARSTRRSALPSGR